MVIFFFDSVAMVIGKSQFVHNHVHVKLLAAWFGCDIFVIYLYAMKIINAFISNLYLYILISTIVSSNKKKQKKKNTQFIIWINFSLCKYLNSCYTFFQKKKKKSCYTLKNKGSVWRFGEQKKQLWTKTQIKFDSHFSLSCL